MKNKVGRAMIFVASTVVFCTATVRADSSANASDPAPADLPNANLCFLVGAPPPSISYRQIRGIKVGKSTYGPMSYAVQALADKASSMGADAIIKYSGSQRFGFWPWRMVRPAARGIAIKWDSVKPDCSAIGGSTLANILADNAGQSKPAPRSSE